MGFGLFKRTPDRGGSGPAGLESTVERYNAYFPRVFAYVHTCVGGEMPAQEIVVTAFYRAFERAGRAGEDQFQAVLFRTARRLCRPALKERKSDDGDSLNQREREVLSLVFDAALTRDQIARLFRIRETTVSSLLVTGLRKLKEQTSPAAATAYLNLA